MWGRSTCTCRTAMHSAWLPSTSPLRQALIRRSRQQPRSMPWACATAESVRVGRTCPRVGTAWRTERDCRVADFRTDKVPWAAGLRTDRERRVVGQRTGKERVPGLRTDLRVWAERCTDSERRVAGLRTRVCPPRVCQVPYRTQERQTAGCRMQEYRVRDWYMGQRVYRVAGWTAVALPSRLVVAVAVAPPPTAAAWVRTAAAVRTLVRLKAYR